MKAWMKWLLLGLFLLLLGVIQFIPQESASTRAPTTGDRDPGKQHSRP